MAEGIEGMLYWITIYHGGGVRRSDVRGPFTDSEDDQRIIWEELRSRCANSTKAELDVDNFIFSLEIYSSKVLVSVTDAQGEELFSVFTVREKNTIVADAIKTLTGSNELDLYVVRRRTPSKNDKTHHDVLRNIGEKITSGGLGFIMGRQANTFLSKKDAIECADKYIFEGWLETDVSFKLEPRHGVLVGLVTSGDFVFKSMYTVTKVKATSKERQDDYSIDSLLGP